MDDHFIADQKVGTSMYYAVWDIRQERLHIAREDGTVILDDRLDKAHFAVHKALGLGPYVTAAPSEAQLQEVIRFYVGK
ncbi:hypothetical protein [Paraburkholderia hospita]|uniref:hypothetical protein n=1 Tax=Paraburkholderia hospita TaxID=169430 RepID=UPI0008A753D4|nr:hypothetical protein [Paraburkholderia hospita]SEH90025.1 hypothetical protein SAMN05192544_1011166 [Paraburkholderia hospita]